MTRRTSVHPRGLDETPVLKPRSPLVRLASHPREMIPPFTGLVGALCVAHMVLGPLPVLVWAISPLLVPPLALRRIRRSAQSTR